MISLFISNSMPTALTVSTSHWYSDLISPRPATFSTFPKELVSSRGIDNMALFL